MTDNLKPCPFCACAMTVRSNRDWHRIDGDHDDDCIFDEEVMMVPATDKHLAEAIAAWNRRTEPAGSAEPSKAGTLRYRKADPNAEIGDAYLCTEAGSIPLVRMMQSTHQPDVSIKAGEIDMSDERIFDIASYTSISGSDFAILEFARAVLLAAKGGE